MELSRLAVRSRQLSGSIAVRPQEAYRMDTNTLIIAALVVVVLALGAMLLMQRRRSSHLQSHFGPEYERTLKETGDKRKAEAELQQREKRVQKLSIRPLNPDDRERFTREWRRTQAEFVDDPMGSMRHADVLLQDVMSTRGYPVENFEQVASDISVDHPTVVQNYRSGHDIAVRHQRGEAGTEDLRVAMIHYRELFDELVTNEKSPESTASKSKRSSDDEPRHKES
jgi:hypothetical protein